MGNYEFKHTVFTPSYNREALIKVLYLKMLDLNYPKDDFEWLIIDDGSTDNTADVVSGFIEEGRINIRYYWQENRGIHCAQNKAISLARGEFVTRIDTDDYLLPNALTVKDRFWGEIPEGQKSVFVGVVGLALHTDMSFRSSILPEDVVDSTGIELQKKYGATGDRNFCMKTEVMRNFPIPEYVDTKYVPESFVWKRIDRKYKTRFINVPLSVCASDADGSMMKEMGRRDKSIQNHLSAYYNSVHQLNEFYDDLTVMERVRYLMVFLYNGLKSKKFSGYSDLIGTVDSSLVRAYCVALIPVNEVFARIKARAASRSK